MLPPRSVLLILSLGIMVVCASGASSQTTSTGSGQAYPDRPIRIVTYAAGGSSDFASRIIAQGISGFLGQQVIIDNRAGVIPGEIVSKAPPDGYTLLVSGNILWISTLLQKTPFDPMRDFSPITLAERSVSVLVVNPSLTAKTVPELIAMAKAKPGELNYGSSSIGSANHLAAELFKAMTRTNIVRVNYKGAAAALNDLIGGQVQLIFATAGSVAQHVKSGRLSALAVTGAAPSALFPGLPTVAATVPGYESVGITGIFAPARTPAAIIKRLNEEIVRFLGTAAAKEKFLSLGTESAGTPPQELEAAMKSDMGRLDKLFKEIGIRVE